MPTRAPRPPGGDLPLTATGAELAVWIEGVPRGPARTGRRIRAARWSPPAAMDEVLARAIWPAHAAVLGWFVNPSAAQASGTPALRDAVTALALLQGAPRRTAWPAPRWSSPHAYAALYTAMRHGRLPAQSPAARAIWHAAQVGFRTPLTEQPTPHAEQTARWVRLLLELPDLPDQWRRTCCATAHAARDEPVEVQAERVRRWYSIWLLLLAHPRLPPRARDLLLRATMGQVESSSAYGLWRAASRPYRAWNDAAWWTTLFTALDQITSDPAWSTHGRSPWTEMLPRFWRTAPSAAARARCIVVGSRWAPTVLMQHLTGREARLHELQPAHLIPALTSDAPDLRETALRLLDRLAVTTGSAVP